jgi:FMN phosphatase YigB (HAD superfamily)
MPPLGAVFFDIGGTLGDRDATGRLVPFDDSVDLLRVMRDNLGLKVGVITNLPTTLDDEQVRQMLGDAGLLSFLDPLGLVTNHAAQTDKPDPVIYRFAANRLGLPVERCLYVGEDPDEVQGAIDAGMEALLKPIKRA